MRKRNILLHHIEQVAIQILEDKYVPLGNYNDWKPYVAAAGCENVYSIASTPVLRNLFQNNLCTIVAAMSSVWG